MRSLLFLMLLFTVFQVSGQSFELTSLETRQLTTRFGNHYRFAPNGRIDNLLLVNVAVKEPSSHISDIFASVLLRSSDGAILELPVEEISIISSRVIHSATLGMNFIEVIGATNMGNGNLYLFDSKRRLLLSTVFYDSHMENENYDVFHRIPIFKDREFNGEQLSRVFRNGRLNIQYDLDPSGRIRIYGFADFISEKDEIDSLILSQPVEEVFGYSKSQGAFVREKLSGPIDFRWGK